MSNFLSASVLSVVAGYWLAVGGLVSANAATTGAVAYSARALAAVPASGTARLEMYALNNQGQVAGYQFNENGEGTWEVIYEPRQIQPTVADPYADGRQVVAYNKDLRRSYEAGGLYYFESTSGLVATALPQGVALSAMGDKGRMTGEDCRQFDGTCRAFITPAYSAEVQPVAISGNVPSQGLDINAKGVVVGRATVGDRSVPFMTEAGAKNAALLSPPTQDLVWGTAEKVNNTGQALVRWAGAEGQSMQYWLVGAGGVGAVPVSFQALKRDVVQVTAMNAQAQLVGQAFDAGGAPQGFVTGKQGKKPKLLKSLVDLPGVKGFDRVVDVNDAGQVLAHASNGVWYVLTPEPAALAD